VTDPSALDARYGRRAPASRARTIALAVAGVGLLVAATTAVYVWKGGARPLIVYTVSGYQVSGAASTRVDFTVDKPAGLAVTCRVEAQDAAGDVVGSQDVPLPAAGKEIATSVTLLTRGLAVLGTVVSCGPTHG
jgi:hypothetical protein